MMRQGAAHRLRFSIGSLMLVVAVVALALVPLVLLQRERARATFALRQSLAETQSARAEALRANAIRELDRVRAARESKSFEASARELDRLEQENQELHQKIDELERKVEQAEARK